MKLKFESSNRTTDIREAPPTGFMEPITFIHSKCSGKDSCILEWKRTKSFRLQSAGLSLVHRAENAVASCWEILPLWGRFCSSVCYAVQDWAHVMITCAWTPEVHELPTSFAVSFCILCLIKCVYFLLVKVLRFRVIIYWINKLRLPVIYHIRSHSIIYNCIIYR